MRPKVKKHNKEISESGTEEIGDLDGQIPNAWMMLPACIATVKPPAAVEWLRAKKIAGTLFNSICVECQNR